MKQENEPNSPAGKQEKRQGGENPIIAWHPAFVEAIQLELTDYRDFLEFYPEYQLTSEPLRIDCVVIRKPPDVVIKKNIAIIFRDVNLLEYKSPLDNVSVSDFYKVYAYACLYASFEKVPINTLTISFIESRYPEKLLDHLKIVRGYTVEENNPGIYTVNGDILPIQIIDSRRLSASENLWLKDLRGKLPPLEIQRVLAAAHRQARAGAYLDAISRANADTLQEAIRMKRSNLTLEQVFENVGWTAKWEARGEELKAIDVAQNMINLGLPAETIVLATKLEPEKVMALYQGNIAGGP